MTRSRASVVAAWITGGFFLVAAIIAGLFQLAASRRQNRDGEPSHPPPTVSSTSPASTDSSAIRAADSVAITLRQYFDSLDLLRDRNLERQEFVNSLLDRRVRWLGFLSSVADGPGGGVLVTITASRELSHSVVVVLPSQWRTRAYALHNGDAVLVEGMYRGGVDLLPTVNGSSLTHVSDTVPHR